MTDVVIVGGGIAGASAACRLSAGGLEVVLLEKQREYHDLVRGEWLAPWGIREAQRLGVYDCFGAGGAWEIREWMTWDEAVDDDEVEAVDMTGFIPGIGGPMSFPHHAVCELMAAQAVGSGARLVMDASRIHVTAGREPVVTYRTPEGEHEIRPRMVLGATGRGCTVGRQIGVTMRNSMHHWGGGMMVEGLDSWPADVQAMGTEGDVMFMVFPQGYGRARLYLNFPAENKLRYRGEGGVERFLAAFELDCLPDRGKAVTEAVPAGPLSVWPSVSSVPEGPPLAEGVVLIGDEAGNADTVLGTGLSCAMRDSRTVCDILLDSGDWSPAAFDPYVREREFRLDRLAFGADIVSRLHVEFGEEAVERRRRARRLMAKNFAAQVTGLLNMVAPEDVPEFGFSEFFAERLFRETA
ncbi:NAD(P)/FAD-dependent oxidoreductase [Herbidospora daliensis]|uniref:NAD(P)/FAD-dependent oxidoreductase n=1 Tax=Herbidospora daliensis TaxID=295585 RepID=UPI0007867E04|nr:FAD-dependent oxidoreductase [Herbidospora daliensis]